MDFSKENATKIGFPSELGGESDEMCRVSAV